MHNNNKAILVSQSEPDGFKVNYNISIYFHFCLFLFPADKTKANTDMPQTAESKTKFK